MFRAYYALPPLTNSKGQATGAILGVINMLKKLVNYYNPNWMVVVFDSKQPTVRHQLFPAYKMNRTKMPEDLASQIPFLLEIIQALGFSIVQIPGLEADDIIGSLAVQAEKKNIFSIISTGDKDLAQLVNENIVLINTMTDTLLDTKGVMEKFNVPPKLMIDYLVLTGDQVDNIPGVANVGPKTAIKWLNKYQNLAGIIKHNADITGKVGDNLRSAIKDFSLYTQLVTIDCNLQINTAISDFSIKLRDTDKLKILFTELEINSWLKEIAPNTVSSNAEIAEIDSEKLLIDWIHKISMAEIFAIHVKTSDYKITGIYLAVDSENCYIDLSVITKIQNITILLNFLQDPQKIKITYDLKYLSLVLDNYAINIVPPFFDILLEKYILNSLTKINFTLEELDANKILMLHHDFWQKICASPKLRDVLLNIEFPVLMILKKMEHIGVLIDKNKLAEQGVIIKEKISNLENITYQLAGEMFNLNSPKQLQEILYFKLGLPVLQKTPTGQPSTSEEVLQELALEFELPKIILQYRTLSKLQSTYIDKLPKNINSKTGRVHTSYNQTVTATGRLSSSDPNLQNIPIRTSEGRSIREAFIARAEYKILSADYSQIELRILAELSKDPGLINAFNNNLDIHTITASEIFHVSLSGVTEELRRKAKAVNFGLIYGMSDFGLAKQLKISRADAQSYINTYFAKFPKVLSFMEQTREFAATHGFVETMFGRRLYLPEINSKNSMRRKAAERAAINAPMQGAQADLIKIAMINIDQWITKEAPDIFMLMQIHDELVFEVPNNKIDLARDCILNIMQTVANFEVNLAVEIGVGDNWAKAH